MELIEKQPGHVGTVACNSDDNCVVNSRRMRIEGDAAAANGDALQRGAVRSYRYDSFISHSFAAVNEKCVDLWEIRYHCVQSGISDTGAVQGKKIKCGQCLTIAITKASVTTAKSDTSNSRRVMQLLRCDSRLQ